MAETPAERHNRIARETFTTMGRQILSARGTDAEFMVVLESVIFGGLLFAERAFNVDRRVSAERLEAMTERVLDRLAEEAKKNG